ncbi:MAG: hypothetical protein EBU33_05720, partial [Sphingobacteriia bacterium]|nr:hypothetical protein [Sphingobacteriia bacterium]
MLVRIQLGQLSGLRIFIPQSFFPSQNKFKTQLMQAIKRVLVASGTVIIATLKLHWTPSYLSNLHCPQ